MSTHKEKIWAVVPAAGIGSRMGKGIPKQYLALHGSTIIEITLKQLLTNQQLAGVVVCIAENDNRWPSLTIASQENVNTAIGGETRAHSVLNGLRYLSESAANDDWVLVHDAARPCLRAQVLNRLIEGVCSHKVGGILAIPAKDTLKLTTEGGDSIEQTLDRSRVWQAQTPQMFRFGLLKGALETAIKQQASITDEASAMELAGHTVMLVEGEAANIKITTDDDLHLAELLIASSNL